MLRKLDMVYTEFAFRALRQEMQCMVNQNSLQCRLYKAALLQTNSGTLVDQRRFKKRSLFPQPSLEDKMRRRAEYNPHVKDILEDSKRMMPDKVAPVITTVGYITSPYVPMEKKPRIYTKKGVQKRWEAFKMFIKTTYSIAVIRGKLKPFKVKEFARYVQLMFIDTNTAVEKNDKIKLQDLATTDVHMALLKEYNSPFQKIHWRFIKELQRPRVVHAVIVPVREKTNLFAQVTVRLCSEQVLAIKDNYGRVIQGNDRKSKRVVDYVVVERHITNEYGQWRICGKVTPVPSQSLQETAPTSLPSTSH